MCRVIKVRSFSDRSIACFKEKNVIHFITPTDMNLNGVLCVAMTLYGLIECMCSADADCNSRDLTLILDSSNPVTSSDWTKLTSFVSRLIADLRRRNVVSRIAAVTFSYRARVALSLANHHHNLLTTLPFTYAHGRNTSGALRLTGTSVSRPIHLECSNIVFQWSVWVNFCEQPQ